MTRLMKAHGRSFLFSRLCGWIVAAFTVSLHTNTVVDAFHSRLRRPWENHHGAPSLTSSSPTTILTKVFQGGSHRVVVFYRNDEEQEPNDPRQINQDVNNRKDSKTIVNEDHRDDTITMTASHNPNNLLHAGDIHWVTSSSSSSLVTQTAATTTAIDARGQRMRDHIPELFAMTRPKNLPGVVLFHMLGAWLGYQSATSTTAAAMAVSYWQLLVSPSLMVTLLALVLTSATSMLVNDYYDYKIGNDVTNSHNPLCSGGMEGDHTTGPRPLPPILVKRFTSYLYAAALLAVTLIPGVPARMAVIGGLMLTFWYTRHLKPMTWLKNAVCASLIAASPLTSGVAALSWMRQRQVVTASALVSTASLGTSFSLARHGSLLRLFAIMFIGILGREMTMDINDIQDDAAHNVRTVPVVYGRRFAAKVAVGCSLGVSSLAVLGPLIEMRGGSQWVWGPAMIRRLGLAAAGGLAQLRRSWHVLQTEGREASVVDEAVDEGLLSVILIMASFV